jgi:hypothetical protein
MKDKHAYVAISEHPFVICGYAPTAAAALKVIAKEIKKHEGQDVVMLAVNSQIDEDGIYCVTAILSEAYL